MKILNVEGIEQKELDLGIVTVGDTKEYVYYLFNNEGKELHNIMIELGNQYSGLKIVEAPKFLNIDQKGTIKLNWTPNLIVNEGLRVSLNIKAGKLLRPPEK